MTNCIRFTIKTLLLCTTAVAVFLGGYNVGRHRGKMEADAELVMEAYRSGMRHVESLYGPIVEKYYAERSGAPE